MKARLDCIPCLLKQSLNATRVVTDDQAVQEKVLKSVMAELLDAPLDYSPPLIAHTIYSIVDDITGCDDPYKSLKMEYNRIAMGMYPDLKDIVDKSDDRLFTAVKLAIAGNIIDFGADIQFDVEETIEDILTKKFAINDYPLFVESRCDHRRCYLLWNRFHCQDRDNIGHAGDDS
jgi:uncharacterized protein with ATP-grasp and redox domains